MPQQGWIFRVLVASPSDCAQERKVIQEVIYEWNAVHSLDRAAVLEPVLWETHSRPELGDRPQAIINRQLGDSCDLLIGAFWTRLGTPTGEAESGTVEEIEAFRALGKPVLLYFSAIPVVPESLDHDQFQALLAYRSSLQSEGLYSTYQTIADFRGQLHRHLTGTMIELIGALSVPGDAGAQSDIDADEEGYRQRALASDFENFLRRVDAEWRAERDSAPFGTSDGKHILGQAAEEVIHLRGMVAENTTGVTDRLDEALRRLRAIQRHQTYMDGGVSFRAFWSEGDEIIELLRSVSRSLGDAQSHGETT